MTPPLRVSFCFCLSFSWSPLLQSNIQGGRIWCKLHERVHTSCLVSTIHGVSEMVCWETKLPSFAQHSCVNLPMATSSILKSNFLFLSPTTSHSFNYLKLGFWTWQWALYSSDLHSHQNSSQNSTFGMWWNSIFTWRTCRRQIQDVVKSAGITMLWPFFLILDESLR